jgi:hypothetical protein
MFIAIELLGDELSIPSLGRYQVGNARYLSECLASQPLPDFGQVARSGWLNRNIAGT